MRIMNLARQNQPHTCNVYYVLGDVDSKRSVNTLVDVGNDPSILAALKQIPTRSGIPKVAQVVITHYHFDHANLLPRVCEIYRPRVYAYRTSIKHVQYPIENGMTLTLGDRLFEIIHTPGHTRDSICLYSEEDGVLFSGDTPLDIRINGASLGKDIIRVLEKLSRRDIRSIFSGHGDPVHEGCKEMIRTSLANLK